MDEPSRAGDLPDRVRRRLDEVFGDVLPDVTRDEAGDPADERSSGHGVPAAGSAAGGSAATGSGATGSETPGDAWLRANRPPHHDDRG